MLRALLVLWSTCLLSCATSSSAPLSSSSSSSAGSSAASSMVVLANELRERREGALAARAEGLEKRAAGDLAGAAAALQRCADATSTSDLDVRDDCFADLAAIMRTRDDDNGDKIARTMLTPARAELEAGFLALATNDRAVARRSFEGVLTRAPHGPHAATAREQLALLVDVDAAPSEHIAPGTVIASLDPDLIHREVRAHSDQIRACYESQLATTPQVFGKIIMRWVIDGAGFVRQATVVESGFANAPILDACLIAAVRTWTFPEPRGKGIVIVNYPFVFKQT